MNPRNTAATINASTYSRITEELRALGRSGAFFWSRAIGGLIYNEPAGIRARAGCESEDLELVQFS